MARINLLTNLEERKGLFRDASVVASILQAHGHRCNWVDFRRPEIPTADLLIAFEVLTQSAIASARRRLWFPNPEWVTAQYLDLARPNVDLACCKSRDAERALSTCFGRSGLVYIGFTSEDHRDATVKRERRFLHLHRGNALAKGTETVKRCMEEGVLSTDDTVIGCDLSDDEVRYWQNRCAWHLCPSAYEGYGHTAHEGLGVGASVVVSDVPALNEMDGRWYTIPAAGRNRRCAAETVRIDVEGLAAAVLACREMTASDIKQQAEMARAAWESERRTFTERLLDVVG